MDSVQEYIDAIAPGHRSLFDRVSGLIPDEFPQASVALSYGMPTYRVGKRRLHIGVFPAAGSEGLVERRVEV
ncbi:hypothetical protein [Streptomyces carpinensis]|uniref:DUF1801 domain-containing protein n=1 Tax=Streptomyces carpinensis TaxID=66369 RepID=A0ABV1VXY3_9ACTN|nr:hypothetical protein [Streptomyces carpinensis]